MAELQDPNSTVMGSMPVKTFYSSVFIEENLFPIDKIVAIKFEQVRFKPTAP